MRLFHKNVISNSLFIFEDDNRNVLTRMKDGDWRGVHWSKSDEVGDTMMVKLRISKLFIKLHALFLVLVLRFPDIDSYFVGISVVNIKSGEHFMGQFLKIIILLLFHKVSHVDLTLVSEILC